MAEKKNFIILRKLLSVIGLSAESIDELVEWIQALLIGEGKGSQRLDAYPYRLREDFLSPAERSFYLVLKGAVEEWALVCPKETGSGVAPISRNAGGLPHINHLLRQIIISDPLHFDRY